VASDVERLAMVLALVDEWEAGREPADVVIDAIQAVVAAGRDE
jgi:hypothetical protein